MAKYDISKQAAEDLYAIWSYTVDTWSESQADKYYSILEDAMKHMLFFTIQKNGRAFLSRVLHERMDFVRYF